MARKLRNPKSRTDKLTPAQLWELVTGLSVNPDRFSFANDEEMRQAWREHQDQVRAWRDEHKPGTAIWIEEAQ